MLDEPVAERVGDDLGPRSHPELVRDPAPVGLDRALAEMEPGADLTIAIEQQQIRADRVDGGLDGLTVGGLSDNLMTGVQQTRQPRAEQRMIVRNHHSHHDRASSITLRKNSTSRMP